jgi:hypothetical protein
MRINLIKLMRIKLMRIKLMRISSHCLCRRFYLVRQLHPMHSMHPAFMKCMLYETAVTAEGFNIVRMQITVAYKAIADFLHSEMQQHQN